MLDLEKGLLALSALNLQKPTSEFYNQLFKHKNFKNLTMRDAGSGRPVSDTG